MIGLSLDYETADRIVRLSLTEHRDYLQSELDQYYATKDTDNPYWLHPEDVGLNHTLIRRINSLLDYYGGELYGERQTRQLKTSPSMVEASARLEAYFLEIRTQGTQEGN